MNRFETSASQEWRPDDLMRYYHDALTSITADHNAAMAHTAQNYDRGVHDWLQTGLADVTRFDSVLARPGVEVSQTTESSHGLLTDVVSQASELFVASLSPADQSVWADIQSKARRHGIDSLVTTQAFGNSSSLEALAAMKAAFDQSVWLDIQSKARRHGIDSLVTTQALGNSSSVEARNAMRAALDRSVWADIQSKARRHGIGSLVTTQALGNSSSVEALAAMKAALDKPVWLDIQDKVKRFGVGSLVTTQALGNSSNFEVREAMQRLLLKPRQANSSHEDFNPYDTDEFRSMFRGRNFRAGFQSSGSQRQRPTGNQQTGRQQSRSSRRETPRPEAPRTNPAHDEARRIVSLVTVDRKFSWLASEDTAAVARVITTVRQIRQKAADDGKVITDKEIYIRYRWQIEKTDPSPRLSQSFRILDAMMGGKPGGKLPF